jgi:LmbE family N-acetylglucosaminyl deacetylase
MRKVRPSILLTHPLSDYMEDHMETARIVVTAAFARGIPNFKSIPSRSPVLDPVTIYHSTPHGLSGPMREPVHPECFVDITPVADRKRAALACHASQKEWLDVTQGMDSYIVSMEAECRELGRRSGKKGLAEGWSRHLHLGFGNESDDPLQSALDGLWSPGDARKSGMPGGTARQRR